MLNDKPGNYPVKSNFYVQERFIIKLSKEDKRQKRKTYNLYIFSNEA